MSLVRVLTGTSNMRIIERMNDVMPGGESPGERPPWVDALTEMFGPDPETGWMDSDAALDAMAWLGRRVFEQSRIDRGYHTKAGLQSQVEATAAVSNTLSAIQALRITQFAATEVTAEESLNSQAVGTLLREARARAGEVVVDLPGRDRGDLPADHDGAHEREADRCADEREMLHPLGFRTDFADVDLAPGMAWGPMQATNRVEDAIDAVTKTPRLVEAMAAGGIDAYRVSQVTRELTEAGDSTCARVEDTLLHQGVTGWTSRRVQTRTRSLVHRLDPAAERVVKKKRAKDAVGVSVRPGVEPGTTQWDAVLWSKDGARARQAVEELARALHASTTADKSLGECRADAMVDLILGNSHVETSMTVIVPIKPESNATTPAPDVGADGRGEAENVGLGETATDGDGVADGDVRAGTDADVDEFSPVEDAFALRLSRLDAQRGTTDEGRETAYLVDLSHPPPPRPRRASRPAPGRRRTRRTRPSRPPSDAFDPRIPDIEVPGVGVIPTRDVHRMLHGIGVRIHVALVDPDTGALLGSSTESYRPTVRIRREVALRDMHCRFPGCEREAKYCDADHVRPWPHGPTAVGNLQMLCRHHHRAKHEGGWRVTMGPDGRCTWISETDHTYVTRPGLVDVAAAAHVVPGPAPLAGGPGTDAPHPGSWAEPPLDETG